MKKSLLLASLLTAHTLLATNGDHLIGIGAKARGMGGVGIAVSHGAESGIANPAMITSLNRSEYSFGGTVFMPEVSFDNGMGAGAKSSTADLSVIPAVSFATKSSENFYWGVGMWGTAGMGVDYRTEAVNWEMVTNLQLMQFGVPLAYKSGLISVGITPVLQYGSLDMQYDTNTTTSMEDMGSGVAQDLAFGYSVGIAMEVNMELTLAAIYKSAIEMEYTGVISNAMAGFGQIGVSDKLEQPSEVGVGLSYTMGKSTLAVDFKRIAWEDAAGYAAFGWKDQNVFAVGYVREGEKVTFRAGFNKADSPINDQGLAGTLNNTLNLLGFPATVESHVTVGASVKLDKSKSVDISYVQALEAENSYTVSNAPAAGTRDIVNVHSQTSVTVQLTVGF